jgi:demethylmenaquinone methyltransferase/2-methoxy-6-polyprenyl-1,4-benzoquinol methylase
MIETNGAAVRGMFDGIAHRYDLTNTVLSAGIHHLWRRSLERRMVPCNRALDIATGTGALVPYLLRRASTVVGVDFSEGMLRHVPSNLRADRRVSFQHADALALPFGDDSFDCVTVAFGVRNYEVLEKGLAEIGRVVRPGGQVLVLEFGQIRHPVIGAAYKAYSKYVLPSVGGLLTGNARAYEYLPHTAAQFPCGDTFVERLASAGLHGAVSTPLCFGMAYIYDVLA